MPFSRSRIATCVQVSCFMWEFLLPVVLGRPYADSLGTLWFPQSAHAEHSWDWIQLIWANLEESRPKPLWILSVEPHRTCKICPICEKCCQPVRLVGLSYPGNLLRVNHTSSFLAGTKRPGSKNKSSDQHVPHCSYKQLRPRESFLTALRMVRTLPKT